MGKKTKLDREIMTIEGDDLVITSVYPIRVGFLPDMHCGASRSICPDEFETKEETIIKPNKIQKYLRILWKRNIELFKKYAVQYILIVGDAFAGSNPAEAGAFISVIDKSDQVKMAAQLLQEVWEVCDKKPIFLVWSGTPYHESRKGEADHHEELVERLKALGITAKYMRDVAYVELFGGKDALTGMDRTRRLFIAHEAATALVYPATLLSRDINWSLESEACHTTLPIDAIIRAHLHHTLHVDHSGKHAYQLPCWLAHTPYKATIKYFFKFQPSLGGAMMLMDEYGRLQFWGGSYPFGFTKDEYIKVHRLCVTNIGFNPKVPEKIVEYDKISSPVVSPQEQSNKPKPKIKSEVLEP